MRRVRDGWLLREDALHHAGHSLEAESSALLQGEMERAGQLGGGRAPSWER